jgi:hypothetical protein
MVRRRSTVRFRKGAPQLKAYFSKLYAIPLCRFYDVHTARVGPSDSEGGLGIGSVGGGSGEPAVPSQQFGSPDLGVAWPGLLLCATTDLKVKPPASDQNAEYASAHYEREDLGQGYRTVSSGFPFEA